MKTNILLLSMVALILRANALHAAQPSAQPPDAGSLMQQQQQRERLSDRLPEPVAKRTTAGTESGVRVLVSGFRFK